MPSSPGASPVVALPTLLVEQGGVRHPLHVADLNQSLQAIAPDIVHTFLPTASLYGRFAAMLEDKGKLPQCRCPIFPCLRGIGDRGGQAGLRLGIAAKQQQCLGPRRFAPIGGFARINAVIDQRERHGGQRLCRTIIARK